MKTQGEDSHLKKPKRETLQEINHADILISEF